MSTRCNKCGFQNPVNAKECMECHSPLSFGKNFAETEPLKEEKPSIDKPAAKKTQMGKGVSGGYIDNPEKVPPPRKPVQNIKDEIICPHCNYPNAADAEICINCKKEISEIEQEPTHNEIIPQGKKSYSCSLKPILKQGEKKLPALKFSAKPVGQKTRNPWTDAEEEPTDIILKRENTEPGNMNISGKSQAMLKNENGRWLIVDTSEFKTTYVQISKPHDLKKGDIILLGDRLFEFDC